MQPKIYTIQDHSISPSKIDSHAYYVIKKLRENGFSAYLVGGSVRDLLLDQTPKDFDISTSAKPEEIKKLFRNSLLIGRRFRLVHIRFGKKIIEVATFRSGDTEKSDLIIRDNDFGTEEQDVLRRDFTINGLFYDPEKEVIIDYVGGYEDLQKKTLRTIGQPELRFQQDPVRMIRLIKFHARFGLNIESSALQALEKCKQEIVKSSQARILEELFRMLESGFSAPFFDHLHKKGLLKLLLPKLSQFFSEAKEDNKVLSFLEQVDSQEEKTLLKRPVLATCLLYPLFEAHILAEKEKKHLHLGQISASAKIWIDSVFSPFFHLSRKMRGTMISVMTSQFRFSEKEKKQKRIRIPRDSDFPLALYFFKIRSELDPSLLEAYQAWDKELQKKDFSEPHVQPYRRFRRRNKR